MVHNISMENNLTKDYIKLHISVLLAGFTGIFGKLITLNEVLLVFYRLSFAFIMLYIILLFRGKMPRESFKVAVKICLIGAILGLHLLLFFASIKYANVAVGVVCYSLVGFFTAILEPLFYKRKLSLEELIFSLIAVGGIALIFNIDTNYRLGIVLGIFSAAVFALYTILNKIYVREKSSNGMLFYEMLGGTLFITIILPFYILFDNVKFVFPVGMNLLYLMILAFFCTLGLYILHIQVLRKLPAFTVSLCGNVEPVYGILLAVAFLGESKELSLSFYIGMALILLSLFLQSFVPHRYSLKQKET